MSNAWLAQVGGDPRQRAREIGRAHSTFIATADRRHRAETLLRPWSTRASHDM